MIKKTACLVAAGVLFALGVFGVGPVLAQDSGEHPTFDRSPDQGPPGTVVKVSGTGCIYYGKPWEYAKVYLSRRVSGNESPFGTSERYSIRSDGSWDGDLVVPLEAPLDEYTLDAICKASDMTLQAGELPFKVAYPSPQSPSPSPSPSSSPTSKASPSPSAKPSPSLSPSLSPSSIAPSTTNPSPTQMVIAAASTPNDSGKSPLAPILVAVVALLVAALGVAALLFLRRPLF